jgi:hypothetical protein
MNYVAYIQLYFYTTLCLQVLNMYVFKLNFIFVYLNLVINDTL